MFFSIIIPIYNEQDNIVSLVNEISLSLKIFPKSNFEIVIVNDGSTDETSTILEDIRHNSQNIKIINNQLNLGQSKSIQKGISSSLYNTIVTIDGDGQNNPKDIPKLLDKFFKNQDIKLVGGIRLKRKDNISKRFASKIANYFRMIILNDNCIDTGCSLKVFDKNVFLKFKFFDGIHRFLPALFKGYGYKTFFIHVDHRKRIFGYSKYGNFSRMIVGLKDIIKVYNQIKNKKL